METIIFTLEELPEIAKQLAKKLKNCQIFTFKGPLGAGKTTLIKELLKDFGVKDEIISPTFTYMNLYKNANNEHFYHFDLYRIKTIDDFLMAGFDEFLIDKSGKCLIEWPEVIEPILKLKRIQTCSIEIDYDLSDDKKRKVQISINN